MRELIQEYLRGAVERFAWYRAQVLALLALLLGLLEVLDPYLLGEFIPDRWRGIVLIALAVAIFLLRKLLSGYRSPEPDEGEVLTEQEDD